MRSPSGRFRLFVSFVDAWRGLRSVFRSEWNFRVHLAALVAVVVTGFLLRISAGEWIAIALCSALVLTAETINTALEYLADAVHPEADAGIGRAKDASAGAVLIAALAAAVVGTIVFLPKIWDLLTK
jgi:diacylglycerol kinase